MIISAALLLYSSAESIAKFEDKFCDEKAK